VPIVSQNIRIRYPELFVVGAHSIVDDYCYFSASITIGRGCHIAPGCSVAGGRETRFVLGDLCGLSAGARVYTASNDFIRDLITLVPYVENHAVSGDVVFERNSGAGANSIVMPRQRVPEGCAIGALSYVPPEFDFEPWAIYAGIPARKVGERDRDAVLAQAAAMNRWMDATPDP